MNKTTAGAATLGAALGIVITWGIGLARVSVPAEVGAAISMLCTGAFGLIFPR